jgi:hypothetical protein
MATWSRFRGLLVVAGVAVAVAATGWLAFRDRHEAATNAVDELLTREDDDVDPRGRPRTGPPPDPRSQLFRECATEVGLTWRCRSLPNEQGETFKINLYDHGCGLAIGDFDGDGHDDVYFCNQLGRNALYRNKGDGTFEDVTEKAGVGLGDRVCVAAAWVDYDNDGKPDLYVTSTRGGNVLFRNNGDGTFTDVTKAAGLEHVGHSQTALFFDFDNDGYLDLYLTNTAEWTSETYDEGSRYWVGKGERGLGQVVQSPKEYNRLYRNNGDGTFTDVTLEALGRTPWGGMGARAFDFNNDGRLDLYIVDMHSDMWMGPDFKHTSLGLARKYEKTKFRWYNGPMVEQKPSLMETEKELGRQVGFRHEEVLFGNACYRNDGGGKFTEVSDQAGLENFWPWGIATGDFDNDGWEDVFVTAGMGYPFYYWPNYLLMNQRNGTFTDRAAETGIEPPLRGIYLPQAIRGQRAARSSRCAATADFDGKGRLEIVVNNFNDQPYFFKNQGPRKNYVAFRLRGTRSNRDAIGAVVRVYQGGKVLTRQVQGACGYLSQSSHTLHFGLGDRAAVERVVITWPSGLRQELGAIAINTRHDVTEPGPDKPTAGKQP